MAWRTVYITKAAKLYYKQNNLIIKLDNEYTVPIKDISTIMIENTRVNITTKLLSVLSENNIVVYFCNDLHLPKGILLPINNHSRHLKMIKYQLKITNAFKNRLWKNIIQCKIENQSIVLKNADKDNSKLLYYKSLVQPGDIDNIESIAANHYFKSLFGNDFSRRSENTINKALNYGYSIIRGAIARCVSTYGFLPVLGIHHHSELNNFNLVDDLFEPYRPIIDLWVYYNINHETYFSTDHKVELYNLLNYKVIIGNKKHSVLNSINITVKSLVTSYKNKNYQELLLPTLIPLELHEYE